MKGETGGVRGRLMNIYIQTAAGLHAGRLGRHTARIMTSARLKITFVDVAYPKGWTGSLPRAMLVGSFLDYMYGNG